MLDSIDTDDHIYARRILITVCLTPVVLDVQTVASMAGLRFANDVIKICTTSFLNVFEGKVQLAHFSVQEFLIVSEDTDQHHFCQFTAADGHTHLAEKTADILLGQTDVLTQATAKDRTAFLYAAKHWNTHLTAAGGMDALKPELQEKISRLFTEPNVYLNWVRAADSDDRNLDNEWSKMLEECQPPIHRASSMGLGRVVENLLEQGADPFQKFPPTRTSKYSYVSSYVMAAIKGQLDVLQVLLDKRSPLEGKLVEAILAQLNHEKAGKVKLESILQTLWDQNLLRGESYDNPDEIGEHVLAATMRNRRSGVEILHVLLDWQPRISIPITPTVLLSAIRYGPDTLKILLDTCDAHVTPEVLMGLEEDECGVMKFTSTKAQSLCILAVKRPTEFPIDEDLLLHFAKFLDLEAMTSLIQARKSDISVMEYHLEKAAKNEKSGGIFGLLWPYRESGIVITEDMLCKAASNDDHWLELMGFMQEHMEPGMSLSEDAIEILMSNCEEGVATLNMITNISSSEFSVSETLAGVVCSRGDAIDLLSLLANKGMNIPITETVVAYAASNELQGPAVFEYLAKIHQKPLPITELALIAAVDNSELGDKVLEILLQDASPSLLTDKVFEKACKNGSAMGVLLDQGRKDLPVEKILQKLEYGDPSSRDVIYTLLDHDVLNVDESLVEKLATNFDALDALISRNPDLPITENALITGTRDHRSIRIMLGVQGTASLVTESVLESAVNVKTYESQKVLEIISHRQGGIIITERVLSAGIKSRHESLLAWLLGNTSESVIKTFFMAEKWQSDSLWTSTTRCALLKAFAQKEESTMTEAMLQNWPFTPESKEYFALDWLVRDEKTEKIKTFATEKAAEIFVERCCNEDIEKFLTENQITVTDHLIQLGEKNPSADQEKLKLFLEQKRDSPVGSSEPLNGDMDVPEK